MAEVSSPLQELKARLPSQLMAAEGGRYNGIRKRPQGCADSALRYRASLYIVRAWGAAFPRLHSG